MEQGNILSVGSNRFGLVTLDDFRELFISAMEKSKSLEAKTRPDGMQTNGDHHLNPGMSIPDTQKPASVLVPIIGRPEHPTILLTRRSDDLPHHAGQVSFPGGRSEDSDVDAVDTALRETEEEIGLQRHHVEVIGQLDEYITRTGFVVTPIVGLVKPPFDLTADPVEVADVFEVPLSFVLDRSNHERHSQEWQNKMRHFYVLPHPEQHIWGATAGMLVNLANALLAVLEA
jgi:8-oxo-dGTP pyrophosphatase MutT (NUDIX family)